MTRLIGTALAILCIARLAGAQGPPQGPQLVSPEVSNDKRVTFRIHAPQAEAVRLNATDIPGNGPAAPLTKGANGVWEVTTPPVPAGAYRYAFVVDGVATMDPRNPSSSESNNNSWSMVYVPGSQVADTRNVPHGSIAEVTYYSTSLSAFRRMHVYTPPGYETTSRKFPVLYLLHGAGDSDDSWSTVGRAGFILDNLIAARSAKPMIVVMPAGHTRGPQGNTLSATGTDAFVGDFVTDVMPYVQSRYRVQTDRASTAIAGLSMGGSQTLNIAIANLEKFGYVGVYSSGLLGAFPIPGRGGAPPFRRIGFGGMGITPRRQARRRERTEGSAATVVCDGQGGLSPQDVARNGRLVQEAWVLACVQGERGRTHVAQLARLSERVRADVVSIGRPQAPGP
jgi:enterochelin esterase family protein